MSGFRKWGEKSAAAILLLVFSPLLIIVAAAIKLDSRGPVVFRQVRIGLDEEPFEMFKFRTMVPEAESLHQELVSEQILKGGSFLLHNPTDPRKTRLGRVLRKSSLDELPQLLNVLNGTMSFVGPRPMVPDEVVHLSPNQLRRFRVTPGITGLAQVNGRSSLGAEDYISLDLRYVDGFSGQVYWYVLLRTPMAVLSMNGAV